MGPVLSKGEEMLFRWIPVFSQKNFHLNVCISILYLFSVAQIKSKLNILLNMVVISRSAMYINEWNKVRWPTERAQNEVEHTA